MESSLERIAAITRHLVPSECHAEIPQYTKPPVRVLITGAAGQIAYSLIFQIGAGLMLGNDQPIIFHLLEIPPAEEALKGVVMELEDCAFPLVKGVVATVDAKVAFKGVQVALFVGAFPRKEGMERKDLLEKNAAIFHSQGKLLNDLAHPNVKVVVVGNPANTNCLLLLRSASSIPARNFSCLTRLDHHRAQAMVAGRLGVGVEQVQGVCIWGNHSATQFADVSPAVVVDFPQPGLTTPVRSAVNDDEWLRRTFLPAVQKRGAAVIAARKLSSAASAANAIVAHTRSWLLGTSPGEIVSMGVLSDGSYGVPEGLIYSFPVRCQAGTYSIVQGLQLDEFSKQKLQETTDELLQERQTAIAFIEKQGN